MTFERTRFAAPASAKDLSQGDLLVIDSGKTSWLGVRVADSEAGWPMAMLLAGPDLHGAAAPFLVDLRGIEEGLGRITVEQILIKPCAGEPVGQPGIAQHGSLLIDHGGEAWLVYRQRSRPGDQHLSLCTFQLGAPVKPTLAYPTWRIVLRDGPTEHELVYFAPGGAYVGGTRWGGRGGPAATRREPSAVAA